MSLPVFMGVYVVHIFFFNQTKITNYIYVQWLAICIQRWVGNPSNVNVEIPLLRDSTLGERAID
jgi:hypothetical protein